MHDRNSPLNGHSLRDSSPEIRRQIRVSRYLVPLTIFVLLLLLTFLLSGCAGWINTTRTGLLSTNAGLNAYDDVAVEVWKDASGDSKQTEQLGMSTCVSVIVQDNIIQAWSITTAVDNGIKKKSDITPYISASINMIDALEDYLEMGDVALPVPLKVVVSELEKLNPGSVIDPGSDPLEVCTGILNERVPIAGPSIPWETIISSGAELGLFILRLVQDYQEGRDIPATALDDYIRDPLKQLILYEHAMADAGGGD